MTISARDHFKELGYLTQSPHPVHDFRIHRLVGEWQLASDYWVHLDDRNKLHRHIFTIEIQENTEGTRILNIVIWRLKIVAALLKK